MKRIRFIHIIIYAIFPIVVFRLFVCEVYIVDSPSMTPAIQPMEVYSVDKFSGGAIMPRRFAEIPIINIFTWITPLREMDERNDWGFYRTPGCRSFREGDVILFHSKDNEKTVLVKRIAGIEYVNEQTYYYVLGDNFDNSTDSRHFGLIPDNLVIGRARYVLFSWDKGAEGFKKIRWKRIGYDISANITPEHKK